VPPDVRSNEADVWFSQAEEDLGAARRLHPDGPARVVCFLAHLAAEKAIKAHLLAAGISFRKTHDLFQLRALTEADMPGGLMDNDLAILNPWVIEGWYPGDAVESTPAIAADAIEATTRVLEAVRPSA
jgi:HEPN domain-containing protein